MKTIDVKVRDEAFDKMKGLAMLLVIMGHCHIMARPIWTFHMPLFFIVAGYFFHQKEIVTQMKGDVRRLLLPCATVLCICLGYGIAMYILTRDINKITPWANSLINLLPFDFTPTAGIGPMWFLFAMFWCKSIYNMVFTLINSTCWKVVALCVLFVIGFLFHEELDIFCLSIGLTVLPFYAIGHLWNQYSHVLKGLSVFKQLGVILCCITIWLFCFFSTTQFVGLPDLSFPNGVLLDSLSAIAFTYVLYVVMCRVKLPCRCTMGGGVEWNKQTLLILCVHTIEMRLIPWDKIIKTVMTCTDDEINYLTFIARLSFVLICLYLTPKTRLGRFVFSIK